VSDEIRKAMYEFMHLRSDCRREEPKRPPLHWLILVLLCLTPALAFADRFDDLLEQARLAKENKDIVAARAALEEAQRELGKPQTPAAAGGGSDTKADLSAGSAIAPSGGASAAIKDQDEDKSVFTELANKGWRLQLGPGLSGPDAGKATLAFARDIAAGTDTEFNANFTLGYSPARRSVSVTDRLTGESVPGAPSRFGVDNFLGIKDAIWVWDASLQGQLSSNDDNEANAWTFRLGGDIWHYGAGALREAEAAMEDADNAGGSLFADRGCKPEPPKFLSPQHQRGVRGAVERKTGVGGQDE